MALLLLGDRIGFARAACACSATALTSSGSSAVGCQFQRGLPASAASSRMARIATCICSWPNTTEPNMTSSDRPLASDSTISTAASVPATTRCSSEVVQLLVGRIQQVLAVLVADARGADRAVERHSRRGRARQTRRAARECPDRSPDRRTARSQRPARRCRSHPETAGGSVGR